jgi:hypothetical protein
MAKKPEEIVQCEKCKKHEARVTHVLLDEKGKVYTSHPIVVAMIFVGIGMAFIPQLPDLWKLIAGAALIVGGSYATVKTYFKRRSVSPGREIYCHSCYHYWWEYDSTPKKSGVKG